MTVGRGERLPEFAKFVLARLAHEIKHAEQYRQHGTPRFILEYLRYFVRHGYGKDIPFGSEAFHFEQHAKGHVREEFHYNDNQGRCGMDGQ